MNLCRALYLNVAIVLAAYMLLYLIGQGPLDGVYTPEWASRNLWWIFAPVTLAAAMFGPVRAWWWSLAGYALGVLLGHVIGEPVYSAQLQRLAEQRLDPAFVQNWQPSHPGWWITIVVFLSATVTGWLVQRRRPAEVTCSRV